VQYGPLKARTLIPVSNEDDPGADTIKLEVLDSVGVAKVVANYATDFPEADVKRDEVIVSVKSLGSSYRYSLSGGPRRGVRPQAPAAVEGQQRAQGDRAAARYHRATGDAKRPQGPAQSGQRAGLHRAQRRHGHHVGHRHRAAPATRRRMRSSRICSASWRRSSPRPRRTRRRTRSPADRAAQLIGRLPRSTTSDTTMLEFFLENQDTVKRVVAWDRCKAAGAGATDRMVAFESNPDKVQLVIPQEFEQFPAEQEGMTLKTPCHARTAGVVSPYPLSICYGDGI
jgi:hypothetical protein